mmetsp:Transcript_40826/g.61671  ORF Transcript_40826/g.61671 Transcript_40826/m.61671 type:complete len:105 (-) Transcript_40826:688-1002(-)
MRNWKFLSASFVSLEKEHCPTMSCAQDDQGPSQARLPELGHGRITAPPTKLRLVMGSEGRATATLAPAHAHAHVPKLPSFARSSWNVSGQRPLSSQERAGISSQ